MNENSNKIVSFSDEQLILVDRQDNIIGYDNKKNVHLKKGTLHRAFSIFLFTPSGKLLLQKRSHKKELWPRYWSNSCCSHPRKGETYSHASQRRLMDELGIHRVRLQPVFKFIYSAQYMDLGSENELCNVFVGTLNEDISLEINRNEIESVKWVEHNDIDKLIDTTPDDFTPWFLLEWEKLRNILNKDRLLSYGTG